MAHNSAVLALGVAIGFINPGSLSRTLGNTITNFLKFLKSIDNLTDRLAPWNLAITYGKAACRTVSKITQEAVFEIQDGLFRARVILNGRLEEFIAAADEIIPASQIDVQLDGTLILRANNQEMPLAGSLASGKKLIADALGITEDLLERFRKLGLRDFEIDALLKKYQSLRTPDEIYDLLTTCDPRNAPALAQDLTKDVNFGAWLFQNVEGVKAWEKAILRQSYRTDVKFLTKLTDLLEPTVISKFPNGQADLDGIIAALVHPHTGVTHAFMKNVADHLDDIKHLVNNHNTVPGFDKVITALKNPNFYAQDGASHLLTKIKSLNAGEISKLEGKILDADALDNIDDLCTDCLFDIQLTTGIKLELKSFGETTIVLMPTSSKFKNQFKAYLASVTDINGFQYIFNGKKTQNLTLIKEKFQIIFTSEAQNIYDALGQAKFNQMFGVDNVTDFVDDIVPNLNGPLYNFVSIF